MADQRFAAPRPQNDDGSPWPTLDHPTHGEIGGARHYEGKAPSIGIWKCPSCRVDNDGPLEQGCASCGAGAPGKHIGVDAPPARREQLIDQIQGQLVAGLDVHDAAHAWVAAHTDSIAHRADPIAAFLAGYALAMARTMKAPPVTADVHTLAPDQKGRRTILAALKLFRDQVLAEAPEEITEGEWCSVAECDALIAEVEQAP